MPFLDKSNRYKYEAKRRRRRKEDLDRLKDVPCTDCGVAYPRYVMEFDHARGVKTRNISQLTNWAFNSVRLQAELAKCDVVCCNCHAIRTYLRRQVKLEA